MYLHALFIACLLLSCALVLSFVQKVAMSKQNHRMRQSKKFLVIQSADGRSGGVSSGVRRSLVVSSSEGEQVESRPAIRQIFRRGLQTKRLAGGEQRFMKD